MKTIRHLPSIGIPIGLLILWTVWINSDLLEGNTLKIAFPHNSPAEVHDPAQIHFTNEYVFLENIYSPLVELSDDKGVPVSSVANEYYWKKNELHFVIRDNLETVDGQNITVDDVIASLKRLLILSKNTHGDFKNLICPEHQLQSMEQDCPRMKTQGNTLILDLEEQRDFVIPMLAAIDFAIIPRSSIDPVTLNIIDYRNTSGPYYMEKDYGGGHITLKANPKHFHFRSNMPQEIVLVPTKGMAKNQILEQYKSREFDHITTIGGLSVDDVQQLDSQTNNFYESINIQTEVAFLTEKGKKNIPLKKRLAFAKSLQKSFHDHYRGRKGHRTLRQFFITTKGGQGLSQENEHLLNRTFDRVAMEQSGKGIFLGIFKSKKGPLEEYEKISQTHMPDLRIEQAKGMPLFTKLADEDIPDYIIVSTDSGFLEDIGLLSYTINAGIFGLPPEEGKAWLKDYMNTRNKKDRWDKLNSMHMKSLTEGLMIPLFSTPYAAVVRKPWNMHFSALFGNNQFWKIRKD